MQDWGSYKVPFGKYKKVKTYRDILQEMTEDAKSYRRYLLSHYEYGSPQLKDLVKYLKAMAAIWVARMKMICTQGLSFLERLSLERSDCHFHQHVASTYVRCRVFGDRDVS